jgi:hypothetical protein
MTTMGHQHQVRFRPSISTFQVKMLTMDGRNWKGGSHTTTQYSDHAVLDELSE